MTIFNLDGTPYKVIKNPVGVLTEAVELVIASKASSLLGDMKAKQSLKGAELIIQDFLDKTNITANLLTGNYETGLKRIAPIFFVPNITPREGQFQCILIALLARLKSQQVIPLNTTHTSKEESILHNLVQHYIARRGESPNDAISMRNHDSHSDIDTSTLPNEERCTLAA